MYLYISSQCFDLGYIITAGTSTTYLSIIVIPIEPFFPKYITPSFKNTTGKGSS